VGKRAKSLGNRAKSKRLRAGRRRSAISKSLSENLVSTRDSAHSTNDFRIGSKLLALSSLLLALSLLTRQSQASDILSRGANRTEKTSKVSAKVKLSFGYDNNVSERREDRVESRFYQFYANSGIYMSPFERTLLSLKLQDGLKYLDAPSLSGESVLINSLNFCLSHRISERLMPEIQSEIRGRTSIHSDSGVLPSEEAYLRGSVGLGLRAVVLSDITGRAFYHYRFINFEDFDPFDRRGHQIGLRADVRLLPGSTIGFQYSRERTRFDKWSLVSSHGDASRIDIIDDLSLCIQLYKYLLFDLTYSHQNNRSDMNGYSYRANRFTLLLARSLPRDFMFQLHALVRSKKYRSASDEPVSTQIDLEDDERGVLTVKLSKDISEDCALEAQYDLRRSSSYKEDGLYTKSVLSFSLSFHL
jgi:hypothetical protein